MSRFTPAEAEELKKPGAIAVLPLDTIYSVAVRANDQLAVKKFYGLKRRQHEPGTLVAASIDQLVELGFKRRYLQAVSQYWPNPISVVIPYGEELAYLHQGSQGLAVRIPNDSDLIELLEEIGPLLESSASRPGQPPIVSIAQAKGYFGGDIDLYVDGGDLSGCQPSAIIRVVDDTVVVVREGAVKIDQTTGQMLP